MGTPRFNERGEPIPFTTFHYGGGFSTLSQRLMSAILESDDFSQADKLITSWYITNAVGFTKPVRITGANLARKLGYERETVSRSITRQLAPRRILIKRGKFGNSSLYGISPYLGGKGPSVDQRQAIKEVNPPEIPGIIVDNAVSHPDWDRSDYEH